MNDIRSDRPQMPDGYGVPDHVDGLIQWESVEQRLTEAKHYWVATTRSDGRPHVVPRWGVWLDNEFLYDGSAETLHARNLKTNPACIVHLESGSEAVVLEGTSKPSLPSGPQLGSRISAAMQNKYAALGYAPEADAWDGEDAGGLMVFTPTKCLAWFDFPNDLTRFRFSR